MFIFFFCCLLLSSATNHFLPIHREAPAFVEQATEQQILVTGIKVHLLFFGSYFLAC
jgi:F0F1-type ATP synthase beta subunit